MSCAYMAKNEFALSKIRALFACEGIYFHDKQSALKSLSETCLPTKLTKIYLKEKEMELLLSCIKHKHHELSIYELESRDFRVSIFNADELDHSVDVTLNKEQAKQIIQALTAYVEDLT